MPRYFLQVSYDGTAFHGSQIQGSIPTVQAALDKALATLLRGPISTFGASRTDEGVHALCNYYHFDTELPLHPHFHYKINAILPQTMAVNAVFEALNTDVNARFDAIARSYRYRIYSQKNPFYNQRALYYPYTLDRELLQETAAIIAFQEDFESFAKRASQTFTFRCRIYDSRWLEEGDQLHYIVRANRFLRGMVRGLVGTQLQVGRGKMSIEEFKAVFAAKDCTKADFSVPGHGLYLEHIEYPEGRLTGLNLM